MGTGYGSGPGSDTVPVHPTKITVKNTAYCSVKKTYYAKFNVG